MKTGKVVDNAKNSNITTKSAKPKLKITEESTLIVTLFERGAYKKRGFDETKTKAERKAQRKKELEKMAQSWFINNTKEGIMVSRDGVNWRKKRPGEHVYHYDAPGWTPLPTYHEVKTQMHIGNEALQYAISQDARPAKMSPAQWKSMSIYDKIELYLAPIANGRKFIWEVLS